MWDFKAKNLLKGETDGSSYPSGGLRATHAAGGYLAVDPTSPTFLRGDTIFIPSCLVSYFGHALDEKTPLLRSYDALSTQGKRLLNLLGYKVSGLRANIGLEQEFFLVDREYYLKCPDLQLAGRTVIGRMPPRGQELGDHYSMLNSLTSSFLKILFKVNSFLCVYSGTSIPGFSGLGMHARDPRGMLRHGNSTENETSRSCS